MARSLRCNTILSKIVPKLILVYIVLAYRLVAYDYYIHCLFLGPQAAQATSWQWTLRSLALMVLHAILGVVLWTYLHIFLARCRGEPANNLARLLPGARLSELPPHIPAEIETRIVIFECNAQGEPLRCFRDSCNGRWKAPRTRHCGDCKTCRPGFDHHCPWFDADITAHDTMLSFLVFLAVVPVLLCAAFAPLVPVIASHIGVMYSHAAQSQHVDEVWWSRRYSWLGGPIYRWCVGFVVGAREMRSSRTIGTDHATRRRLRVIAPNLSIVILFICAIALSLIAIGLLISTLRQLARGDLTIDAEIRKRTLRAESKRNGSSQSGTYAGKSDNSHSRFFYVPRNEFCQGGERAKNAPDKERGLVVPWPAWKNPYEQRTWQENMRVFRNAARSDAVNKEWTLGPSARYELLTRAREQAKKGM